MLSRENGSIPLHQLGFKMQIRNSRELSRIPPPITYATVSQLLFNELFLLFKPTYTHMNIYAHTRGCTHMLNESVKQLILTSEAKSCLLWDRSGLPRWCQWYRTQSPANPEDLRDTGQIPGSGRSPGGRHGNPLQYSCLENSMDRGAWGATVHGVTKSRTQLNRLSTHAHTVLLQDKLKRK